MHSLAKRRKEEDPALKVECADGVSSAEDLWGDEVKTESIFVKVDERGYYIPRGYQIEGVYDSNDDDFEEKIKREIAINPLLMLLSRDKRIRYTREGLPNGRPPASHSFPLNAGPTPQAFHNCTSKPLSAFLLCIAPVEKTIVEMTNLCGQRKYQSRWQNVDIATMRGYYGLLLFAGVYRSDEECITELWDVLKGRPLFWQTMPLHKFQIITECLRFDDKEKRNTADKAAPIRTVLDTLVQRFQALYTPGQSLAVDKQLVELYTIRCPILQYRSTKANPCINFWTMCDTQSLYVYNLDIDVDSCARIADNTQSAKRVVLKLSQGLENRNVTCNNYFTSYTLASELADKQQITLVGELHGSRKEIPPCAMLDMGEEQIRAIFEPKLGATVVSYARQSNHIQILLSTFHRKYELEPTKYTRIVEYYTVNKCAVNKIRNLIETYSTRCNVSSWPITVFTHLLDIAALNALIIFSSLHPKWKANLRDRRRQFLIEVGEALTQTYIQSLPYDSRFPDQRPTL